MSSFSGTLSEESAAVAVEPVREVAVVRSSGVRETGWQVEGVIEDTVWVTAPNEGALPFQAISQDCKTGPCGCNPY